MKTINNFRIGDVLQINLVFGEPKDEEWVTFWNNPIRDSAEQVIAKEIVETRGGSLGTYSAAFPWDQRHHFRTVTPPAPLLVLGFDAHSDHYHNSKTGLLLGAKG